VDEVVVVVIVEVAMCKPTVDVVIGTSVTTPVSPLLISEADGSEKSDTPKIVMLSAPFAAIASVRWSARPVATSDVSPSVMLLT